jgi:magnesium transporter
MRNTYKHKNVTWVDLESPTKEEIREVIEEYRVHPLIAEELLIPTLRPKVDLYDDSIYLILHFPSVTHSHSKHRSNEIDFVIGKNYLVTVHYESIDSIHEFSKIFEVNSILDKSNMGDHSGYLLFYLLRELYKNCMEQLFDIDRNLKNVEERIFHGEERDMVRTISHVNRKLLAFKQAIQYHKGVLESFETAGRHFFGEKFSYHLRSMLSEYYKVASTLEGHRDTVNELRDTNDSLLSSKTNEIMKTLTVMAFIILPMTFVGQIFGVSFQGIPFQNSPDGFWIVFGIMAFVGFAGFAIFKYKKWL